MNEPTTTPESLGAGPRRARELAALSVCLLVGVLLSILPHLLWQPRLGRPVWISDNDELLYLSIASQAYHDHPFHISDPASTGDVPSPFPWLQFVPGIVVARALGLGPFGVSLIWRVWAGLSIAAGWYLLLRQELKARWLVAALVIFLLADVGMLSNRLIYRQAMVSARIMTGRAGSLLENNPSIHTQWRIITPGLSLGCLLLHIWLVNRARERPSRSSIVLAGAGFGLLFHVYFYYWTAAGLALLLSTAIDAGRRWIYLGIGTIGAVVGLPAVAAAAMLKRRTSAEWLERSDKFVPIDRFSELLAPKWSLLVLVLTLAWVWFANRRQLYLWFTAASSMLLVNHQVFTGLQIENFHWCYVWGPCLSLLVTIAMGTELSTRLRRPRPLIGIVLGLFAVHLCAGFWLRAVEATRSVEVLIHQEDYRRFTEQRSRQGAPGMRPNSVVAGDGHFVDIAIVVENARPLTHYSVIYSPSVDAADSAARDALNGVLLGVDRPTFLKWQIRKVDLAQAGPWRRDPTRQIEARMAAFDGMPADLDAALDRFQVRYVALPVGETPPAYLQSGWMLWESGPFWSVWERPVKSNDLRSGGREAQETSRPPLPGPRKDRLSSRRIVKQTL